MDQKKLNSESGSEQSTDDEFASKKMTEEELKFLIQRVDREWPIRCKLAELAGFKANPKNPRALMDTAFDLSIRELYLEVLFRQPQNVDEALKVIRSMHAAEAAQWAAEDAAKKAAKEAKRNKK